jgi:protein-L-isoaspartate(D-aspartate) O-methyltransferase
MVPEDEDLPSTIETGWHQAVVSFPGRNGVPPEAAAVLLQELADQRFWFMRKLGKLRLRTEKPIDQLLDKLVADGFASGWLSSIYEPEIVAFGGPEGMDVAHDLFCADSPAALADTGRAVSRERCVLLISSMLRAAGLDRFEVGDVWAKLAAERPQPELSQLPSGQRRIAAVAAMRRLMNTDAAKIEDADQGWADRVTAFETAGRRLARLNSDGLLTRGLRAVLAHHLIFTLNRGEIGVTEQAAAAWLAQDVIFADGQPVSTRRFVPGAPSVGQMETVANATPTADPAELREALVNSLTDSQWLRTPAIIGAFRSVERQVFIPDVSPEQAYKDDAVSVKKDDAGVMLSCISQPTIVATQLEQLDARPGQKVFEAGAATGYNAALLAHLVGEAGHVWTVDVDEDLVDGARDHLAAAGVSNVTVLLADGAAGLPEQAPFDRIQFTVGTADLSTAVLDQLAPGGRIVIPMRIRGSVSRSFALERDGDFWKSVSSEMATFVPLRKGAMDDEQDMTPLEGPGDVRIETFPEQDIDLNALRAVLDQPARKADTAVKIRPGFAWEWLYLWLACELPNGLSRMPGRRPGFTPHFSWGSMAALEKDSLAYLTLHEGTDDGGVFWEIGVIGHGLNAGPLTDLVVDSIRGWYRHGGNSAPAPTFRMATGPAREQFATTGARFVIDKTATRIAVDWP